MVAGSLVRGGSTHGNPHDITTSGGNDMGLISGIAKYSILKRVFSAIMGRRGRSAAGRGRRRY